MYAGEQWQLLGETKRSPDGFYRTTAEEIWPDIDPYMMTREQLDARVKAGIKLYEKYFPNKDGFGLFEVVLFTVAAASVATMVAGTAAAAGGAGQAAAQGAAASSATATANASAALAAAGPQGGAWAAASSAGAGAGASASGFAAKAVQAAQKGASYASKIGKIAKASGNSEADKLIKAANLIEGSGSAKDLGANVFEHLLKERQMELSEDARKAARARMAKENEAYAAWMRRKAEKMRQGNPDLETKGQLDSKTWLPILTPIAFFMLSQR